MAGVNRIYPVLAGELARSQNAEARSRRQKRHGKLQVGKGSVLRLKDR